MDLSNPDQTLTNDMEVTGATRAAGPRPEAPGLARKRYTRPRLTEHGRVPALTFGQISLTDGT